MISAKVIQDSISEAGIRICTMELIYPRFIHSEFMTHRVFSRNAASSRAIPIEKMIETIENNPAMPIHWGKNQAGMQAKEELDTHELWQAQQIWLSAAKDAIAHSRNMANLGVHKQITNRITEPFQWMKVVVTATDWENFFWLRDHCYSADTEVLTSKGWRLIKDVNVDDEIVSLNTETRKLENVGVEKTIQWESEGFGVEFKGSGVDLIVSEEHKMLVMENGQLNFRLAKDLVGTNPRLMKNCFVSEYDENTLDYKKGKLLGFYLGNGWAYKNNTSGNSGIVLCKGGSIGGEVIENIHKIAKLIYKDKSVTLYEKDNVQHCKIDGKSVYDEFVCLGKALDKDIPEWVWDSSIDTKRGVFDGMMLADSNMFSARGYDSSSGGGLKYFTSSKNMANSFQRLCLEVGYSATIFEDKRVGKVSNGTDSTGKSYSIETKNIGYSVSINKKRNTPKLKQKPKVVEYFGDFVCLSLKKNGTMYVRRKGKAVWSGNCDAQPEIRELAKKMKEAMQTSEPFLLYEGEYHVPYVDRKRVNGVLYYSVSSETEKGQTIQSLYLEDAKKVSASCCAQVSYRKSDNTREKAKIVFDRLINSDPCHSSPVEHQATPLVVEYEKYLVGTPEIIKPEGTTHSGKLGNYYSNNFRGWIQYRALIPNNVKPN